MFSFAKSAKLETIYPKHYDEDRGGSVEIKKDDSGAWVMREQVITNKLNGISGAVKVGDKLYLGSRSYSGILVCDYNVAEERPFKKVNFVQH